MSFVSRNHPQQVATRGPLDEIDDRGTDAGNFKAWNQRFGFTLDVAAALHNAKAARYFTRADDGLKQSWAGERVWCNPPYSDCGAWVRKAWDEWNGVGLCSVRCGVTLNCGSIECLHVARRPELIVMLLPANRVEQGWWQDHVEPHRDRPGSPLRVEFLRGRLRFDRPGVPVSPKGDRPPFGCCLLIWGGGDQ